MHISCTVQMFVTRTPSPPSDNEQGRNPNAPMPSNALSPGSVATLPPVNSQDSPGSCFAQMLQSISNSVRSLASAVRQLFTREAPGGLDTDSSSSVSLLSIPATVPDTIDAVPVANVPGDEEPLNRESPDGSSDGDFANAESLEPTHAVNDMSESENVSGDGREAEYCADTTRPMFIGGASLVSSGWPVSAGNNSFGTPHTLTRPGSPGDMPEIEISPGQVPIETNKVDAPGFLLTGGGAPMLDSSPDTGKLPRIEITDNHSVGGLFPDARPSINAADTPSICGAGAYGNLRVPKIRRPNTPPPRPPSPAHLDSSVRTAPNTKSPVVASETLHQVAPNSPAREDSNVITGDSDYDVTPWNSEDEEEIVADMLKVLNQSYTGDIKPRNAPAAQTGSDLTANIQWSGHEGSLLSHADIIGLMQPGSLQLIDEESDEEVAAFVAADGGSPGDLDTLGTPDRFDGLVRYDDTAKVVAFTAKTDATLSSRERTTNGHEKLRREPAPTADFTASYLTHMLGEGDYARYFQDGDVANDQWAGKEIFI